MVGREVPVPRAVAEAEKVVMSWSGGKDSTLALHDLLDSGRYEVVALLTTVTAGYDRISIHGVRRALLERQARALGLPLEVAELSPQSSNAEYEHSLGAALEKYRHAGIRCVAYGDLYLEDIRRYREGLLEGVGMRALFPVWGQDTREFAQRFLDLGYRAVTTCVDSQALDAGFVGREYDRRFLAELPAGVDPCGENGEFHTFVYDGPLFHEPVRFGRGEVVVRDERFLYCDLLDASLEA